MKEKNRKLINTSIDIKIEKRIIIIIIIIIIINNKRERNRFRKV